MPAGSTYTPIATTTLGSSQASVTFSSISGYTDLRLVMNTGTSVNAYPFLQFNSDTGSNYSLTELLGNGSSASSSRGSNMTHIQTFNVNTTTAIDTMMTWDIMNYSNSTTNKTVLLRSSAAGNGTNAIVGMWRNTSAITSVDVGCILSGVARTFNAGSTFTLYGIAAA
jgi:hypothetical protein